MAQELNITHDSAGRLIYNGKLGNPLKCIANGAKVNAVSIEAVNLYLERKDQYFRTKDAASYLGITHPGKVSKFVKEGYFPNAVKEGKIYYIPLNDLEDFKKLEDFPNPKHLRNKKKKKTNIDFGLNKADLLNDLLLYFKNIEVPKHLVKTKDYYVEYISIRISSLNKHISYIKSECSRAKKSFENIIMNLPKDVSLLTDDMIQELVSNEAYALSHRQLVNWFFQYTFRVLGMGDKETFVISPLPNPDDDGKEVYSPETYLEYIDYTKNVERHIENSLKSQYYANMWLYTIMHLMDSWRAIDIVNDLPNIEIETLNINKLEWFLKNRLSVEQAQLIINQVYLKTRGHSTSKTNSLLTFLVPMDFVLPAGNAFAICELHRRQANDKYLLQSLMTKNLKARKPNGKHLEFFKYNKALKDFKSLVMNRSTMVYLFNSIVDDSPDPELALTYTQLTRSHEKESSTAVYVKSTNFDGSLGNVSLNLFNRGHFGWIYNTLIKLMLEETKTQLPIDVRTHYIKELRKEFSPKQLEEWSTFLKNVDKRREPILNKLKELTTSEIKELIGSIFKGDMPSRNKHGQCLTYPDCKKPHLKSCFSCEYFIPQVYTIIHANQEIEQLIESIETTKYETIIERDSHFLKKYLLILNKAISVYGQKYIEKFIDLKDIRKRVLKISPILV
ncbi:Helix-turn-helix domain protein [Paraliobacillus sp. PM-2]|uniref:helix-turn-helix domain-containing protein n=1 Tax=Paraliobacillus sp. PM-2 TaxID=1462524 RepID=UPI00061CC198|nr:helix-turn-helix domain-containing protein [Paraliobacillus sp. PM-2]CQR46440.1 Helix-turn-helix domain protein [Paraliobacillus sp. PM-2]